MENNNVVAINKIQSNAIVRTGVVKIGFTMDVAHGIKLTAMEILPGTEAYVGALVKTHYETIVKGLIQERKLELGEHDYHIRVNVDMLGSSMKMHAWPTGEDEPDWNNL